MNTKRKMLFPVLATIVMILSGCADRKIVISAANETLKPIPTGLPGSEVLAAVGANRVGALEDLTPKQWSLKKVEAIDVVQDESSQMSVVAVVSTGVDYNHPAIRPNIFINSNEATTLHTAQSVRSKEDKDSNGYKNDIVGYDVIDRDGLPFDRVGPGTMAAGIVGAVQVDGKGTRGIVSKVKLLPVRYVDDNGQSTPNLLVSALKYVEVMKVHVVLLQLALVQFSTDKEKAQVERESLDAVLASLAKKQILIVLGAGNRSTAINEGSGLVQTFAKYPNVTIVTSTNEKDQKPALANYGMKVDLSAPGSSILSTSIQGSFATESGTFFAAAHVAGAYAAAVPMVFGKPNGLLALKGIVTSDAASDAAADEMVTMSNRRLNVAKFLQAVKRAFP